MNLPNPGSPEAVKEGCTCPVEKNRNGDGFMLHSDGQAIFVIELSCPIHGRRW